MKAFKIGLVVIVVGAIGAGSFFWIQSNIEPEVTKVPENQFTAKIEQEIIQLKEKPDSKFCRGFYKEVTSHINEFHKPMPPKHPYGRYGKTQSENDQWKENLEKMLYSAYAEKFIKQVKTVFRGSEWKLDDLKFIQAEKNELKTSKLLISGSPVDKELATIQTTLNKYNEIASFISSCKSNNYPQTKLDDHFPIAEVQSKIQRALSLRQNRLGNEYVNNCTRLHEGLKEIPKVLFQKHVSYLDKKIDYYSNSWCDYISQKEYSQLLNNPLRFQINDLGNAVIYTGVNVDDQYNRLFQKWQADKLKATNATYPCKQ